MASLAPEAIQAITARLSVADGVRLPMHMSRDKNITAAQVCTYLSDLLSGDPSVFLERHGAVLTSHELSHFQQLRSDYEINHWLTMIENARQPQPSSSATRLAAGVKNRRLAYMQQLHAKGEFFSDEAMRHRAPLIHHEYVGQFEAADGYR